MGAGKAELPVGTALDGGRHVTLLDLLDGLVGGGNGEGGGDESDLLNGAGGSLGVTLLGGVGSAGEDNQALLVGLEALDVDGERLLGEVLAAGVDGDADGGSVVTGDASLLGDYQTQYDDS